MLFWTILQVITGISIEDLRDGCHKFPTQMDREETRFADFPTKHQIRIKQLAESLNAIPN